MMKRMPTAMQHAHESLRLNPRGNVRARYVIFKCHLADEDETKG